MDGSAVGVSADSLIRLGLVVLYTPIVLFSYWRLIPRLSGCAKQLATVMLAAQILVILLAQFGSQPTDFDRWLWDFHEEWNIPATLAYLQLGLVGGVALLTAWLARRRAALQRLYLVGVGLVFLFLAADEYLALHEAIQNWELRYILLGVAMALATLLVGWRSPRRSWLWHGLLLAGLALSVAGAMVINALPIPCGSLAFLRFDGCLEFFVLEESFEFLGIWLTLVAALGHFSGAAPVPSRRVCGALVALPLVCLLALVANALAPRLEARVLAQPAAAHIKGDIILRGYQVDRDAEGAVFRLYVSAPQRAYMGLGYSIHLVDQVTGESVASRDEWADRQHGIWLLGADHAPVYRQWMDLRIPAETPVNRAYWAVLTLWRRKEGEEFKRQKVLASDLQLLDDRQMVLSELVLSAAEAGWSTAPIARFDNGFALGAVELPAVAQGGERLDIRFAWRSEMAGGADYSQFLHFVHSESGDWWGYDQAPLGARLPTRLWYAGLADSETWHVPLPADLAPGRYTVYTGLYRVSDQERVPVTNADGAPWPDNRVALGSIIVE